MASASNKSGSAGPLTAEINLASNGDTTCSIRPVAHGMSIVPSSSSYPSLTVVGQRVDVGSAARPGSLAVHANDETGAARKTSIDVLGNVRINAPSVEYSDVGKLSFSARNAARRPAWDAEVFNSRLPRTGAAADMRTLDGDVLYRTRVYGRTGAKQETYAEYCREEVRQERGEGLWGIALSSRTEYTLSATPRSVQVGSSALPVSLTVFGRKRGTEVANVFHPSGDLSLQGDLCVQSGMLALAGKSPTLSMRGTGGSIAWETVAGDPVATLKLNKTASDAVMRMSSGISSIAIGAAQEGCTVEALVRTKDSSVFRVVNAPDALGVAQAELSLDRKGTARVSGAVHSVRGTLMLGDREEVSGFAPVASLEVVPASPSAPRRVRLTCDSRVNASSLELGEEFKLAISGSSDVALIVDAKGAAFGRDLSMRGVHRITHLAKPFEDHHAATLQWTRDYVQKNYASKAWVLSEALAPLVTREAMEETLFSTFVTKEALRKDVQARMVTAEDLASMAAQTESALKEEIECLRMELDDLRSAAKRSATQVIHIRQQEDALVPHALSADREKVVVHVTTNAAPEVSVRLPEASSVRDGAVFRFFLKRMRGVSADVSLLIYHEGGSVSFSTRGLTVPDNPLRCDPRAEVTATFCAALDTWFVSAPPLS